MNTGESDRQEWVMLLARVAEPVLRAAANDSLKRSMPIESVDDAAHRARYTHLEAIGRLLAGMAPWFEATLDDGPERQARDRLRDMARIALGRSTDPASEDRLNFSDGRQPLVDAAFLAHALLRAPRQLWSSLADPLQNRLITALESTRVIRPAFNNWLLFSAVIEAFLARVDRPWDATRVDYALRQHMQWYKGDGAYGDGPWFRFDYYNSFVIHPMMMQVLDEVGSTDGEWAAMRPVVLTRAQRMAEVLERMIAPDGSFPAIGRSITYRCGAFQLPAQLALTHQLPASLPAAQVRAALTAVIRRTLTAPGTFDEGGWLRVGLSGHQPSLGEPYISTGSLYLCTAAFLPLGLPPDDTFWQGRASWTGQRLWTGMDAAPDKALHP